MSLITLPRRRPLSPLARAEAKWGLIFIAPWIVGFLAFTLLPMAATFVFTLTNISLDQKVPLSFVGLTNYQNLLSDPDAWGSLGVTLRFAILALPINVLLPLAVALILSSRHLKGSGLFRVLFFLPYVVPFVAGVLIWETMLNPADGWINEFLRLIGIREGAEAHEIGNRLAIGSDPALDLQHARIELRAVGPFEPEHVADDVPLDVLQ